MVMLRFTLKSVQLNITMNLLQIQTPLQSKKFMMMKWTIYYNYSTNNMMMIFCMLNYRCFRLEQWSPLLQSFIQSLLCFFYIYVGDNVAVTNCMSQFYMFLPTKTTLKLANVKTGHAQGIGMILYHFIKCSIIYPVGPVYYCPGHPYNTI